MTLMEARPPPTRTSWRSHISLAVCDIASRGKVPMSVRLPGDIEQLV
jgi:hypothetical protein